jgi:hypothetical protein
MSRRASYQISPDAKALTMTVRNTGQADQASPSYESDATDSSAAERDGGDPPLVVTEELRLRDESLVATERILDARRELNDAMMRVTGDQFAVVD